MYNKQFEASWTTMVECLWMNKYLTDHDEQKETSTLGDLAIPREVPLLERVPKLLQVRNRLAFDSVTKIVWDGQFEYTT